ncbi:hypothetical protein M9458_056623 [Cirrhinus mrigala]|uniref:Uncharacterized protein n=1 Tax=Cirrhinus mrigala TaxID=683832 RepID=A0ABD0MIP4_CIRMR
MAVTILSVWAAHYASEASSVHESASEASSVHESAPEALSVHESAPEASSVHESAPEALSVHESAPKALSDHESAPVPPEVAAFPHGLSACPVTAMKAVNELTASPVTAMKANYELIVHLPALSAPPQLQAPQDYYQTWFHSLPMLHGPGPSDKWKI